MTTGPEWKHILLFAIPVMLGNLLQQLYTAADGVIVGKFVGENAFSSIGTTQSITFLCLAFAMGMGVGSSVVISQYFGANKTKEIPTVIDTALILSCGLGIIISILSIVFTRFLVSTLLNVPEHLMADSILYFRIYAAALVFSFIYNCIASILRGVGDSKATLYFLLVSTVLNVILDLLFVAVFDWGVTGAAVATGISQVVCALVSYLYLRHRFKAAEENHFDPAVCRMILRLGVPSALQQSIVSFGHIAMQRLVNGFGQFSIAAYTAGNRIDNFIFVPIMGLSTALSSFTGQNIGAGNLHRTKRGLRFTIIVSVTISILISVVLNIFATPVISLFSLSGESLIRGVEQVKFITLVFWIFAIYMTIGGVLQGSGDVLTQSAITLSALVVRVVLGYICVGAGVLGYEAAWVTTPIGWAVALIISIVRYFTGGWKKKAIVGNLSKS